MSWNRSYVYLGGRLLATTTSNGTQFQHSDRLGTRLITAASDGSVISEQVGLPYGTQLPNGSVWASTSNEGYQSSAQPNPHKRRFTSYDRSDTTGLDYAVNRHYNSQQGRFTQVDPIGMSAANLSDPQSLNLYAYCGNDPINQLDPDGLFWGFIRSLFKWVLRIAAVIVVIGAIVALSILGSPGAGITLGQVIGMFLGAAALGVAGWTDGKVGAIISAGLALGAAFLLGVGAVGTIIQNYAATGVEASGKGIVAWILLGVYTFNAVASFLQKQKEQQQGDGQKIIENAVSIAGKALRNSKCASIVKGSKGKDPSALLKTISGKGNIRFGNGSHTNIGSGSKAVISLDRALFNDRELPLRMFISDLTQDLNTAQAIEVLHELSHATNRYSHKGYTPGDEEVGAADLNRKIYENCFKGK